MDGNVRAPSGAIRVSHPHDSARKQVRGEAVYIDDILEPAGTLHIHIGQSAHAHARIRRLDLAPVLAQPGVVDVLSAADIPGRNEISCAHAGDEPVLADDIVHYHGQPIFAVAAETLDAAREAARHAIVEYEPLEPILSIDDAMARESFLMPPRKVRRGDPEGALSRSPHRVQGRIEIGGQDHFYLEGQISLAVPGEDSDLLVYCSTQNPSEVQHLCARVMDVPDHAVSVEVRRMGGAFGGKETQPAMFAAIACLAAAKTGRPAKLRLDRDDDMRITGKRHDFVIDYDVGFDDTGRVLGISFVQKLRCGYATDLSGAIADRGIFHADNAYYLENVTITSYRCRTHTASNTAFRGFGVPQGAIGIERALLDIAHHLGRDPVEVRRANFYGPGRDITHYGQRISNFIVPAIVDELIDDADYEPRRREITAFNQANPVFKRGMALTPVMMGISFTRLHLNQAGALVHVYKDGSIALNHGGTEMGQGLFVKVAQIVANEFGVDLGRIRVTATTTEKVPNTSPTASSSGSDVNGMAARQAARKIKRRIVAFAAQAYEVPEDRVRFIRDTVHIGDDIMPFDRLVNEAHLARVPLSATGFYATPEIHFDNDAFLGHPFLYFCYGAAISEVIVDSLTGEYRVERVDILHDVGRSLNPAIDIGQIEGGFIQGMGWLTTEELWWDDDGRLRTHAPSTYKIPAASDRPTVMNVRLANNPEFRGDTPYWSKAVGEPPLILSISVHQALIEAVAAARGDGGPVALDAPATPERVLMAIGA